MASLNDVKRAALRILDGSPSGTTVDLFATLGIPRPVLDLLEQEGKCWSRKTKLFAPAGVSIRTYYPGRPQ